MKIIRYLLFPIMPVYFVVSWLRNKLYDLNIKPSQSYNFPVVCVGNLSTGGTGKTPMIEYLIRLLEHDYKLATLSRGYKRSSKGFVLANEEASAASIGDEPFQFYSKFNDIYVAVDANRQEGIRQLRALTPQPELILLDDAFQHRKVNAKVNILLTSYAHLFFKDVVLPTGNLREPRSGAKRAHIIIVTKCPENITDSEKQDIIKQIQPDLNQTVYFSHIQYSEKVYNDDEDRVLESLPPFTLVTGIANPNPLVAHLKHLKLSFEHSQFTDHYNFNDNDIDRLKLKDLIITTEKDYVRLKVYEALKGKLFYLPIEMALHNDEANEAFDSYVKRLITT